MNTNVLIIRPTAVFRKPNLIVARNIVVAPKFIPFGEEIHLYLSSGKSKKIILHTEITTSSDALKDNSHGYTYTGDIIEESDIVTGTFISNLSYDDTLRICQDFSET